MARVLKRGIRLRIAVGQSLSGDVGVSETIHSDGEGLVVGTSADQRRENPVALRIEFDDETIQTAADSCLKRSIAGGEIVRGCAARQVNATLVVERNGEAAIVVPAADVGGENQRRTGRIEAQDECVDDAGVPVLEGVGDGKIAGVRSPADISRAKGIDRNPVADIVTRTAEVGVV